MLGNSLNLHDSYLVLELPQGAPLNDAKAAYRDLVRIWHPDRFQADDRLRRRCEEKVKQLNAAYQTLEAALGRQGLVMGAAPAPAAPTSYGAALEPQLHRGKWGYADRSGSFRISPVYDTASAFFEGLAAVSQGGACGYVSEDGTLAIELRFTVARRFSEGLAMVKFGRCGYINKHGEWAVRPRFDAGLEFCSGVAPVKLDGKWGIIDAYGKWLVLPRFDDMNAFESGRALAREGARSFAVYPSGDIRPL